MNRSIIRNTLYLYQSSWAEGFMPYPNYDEEQEKKHAQAYLDFVDSSDQCFLRSHVPGHVTGSALVCSENLDKILLMHHKKLNKWLQMGGHADGCHIPHEVALKEAQEESGLQDLDFLNFRADLKVDGYDQEELVFPFDIDIHEIPARKSEPSHLHYDIRYLVVARSGQEIQINHEANDLRWVDLEEARQLTEEPSMLRQFDKLLYLKKMLKA